MADLALVTAGKLRIVGIPETQFTSGFAETCAVGQAVRLHTDGKWTPSKGTDAAEARMIGILASKDGAAASGTVVRKGLLDGYDISALAYGALVYLSDTDGTLADATGTVSLVVGRVVPGTSTTLGTSFDKILFVDL
jgi:hypothetical protein